MSLKTFLKKILISVVLILITELAGSSAFGMGKYKHDLLEEVIIEPSSSEAQYNIYKSIATENLKSLNSPTNEAGLCATQDEFKKNGYKAFLKSNLEHQLNPNEDNKQRLILSLLAEYFDQIQIPNSQIMDEITWQDLNLLCGPKSNPRAHLASKITKGRTLTAVGTATIFRMLVQPTSDIQKLLEQQKVTKELINNTQLFNELDAKLKELILPENILLSFWNPEDIFSVFSQQMKTKVPLDDKIAFVKKFSEWLNKSPAPLEIYSRIQSLFGYVGTFFLLYGTVALPTYALTNYNIIPGLSAQDFNTITPYSILGVACWTLNKILTQNVASRIKSAAAMYNYADQSYYLVRYFDEDTALFQCIHKKISYVATYMRNLKKMAAFIMQHPLLTSKMPAVKKFVESLKNIEKKSSDFGQLLKLLETNTFKGEYSRLSYFSRIPVAYKLIQEQKEYFVEAMLAIGELDAQLTIAKLYKEFANKHVTFCFPEYLTNSKLPAIKADEFWNPFLDPEKAVSNSIKIGSVFNAPQNVVITGPNAGGKSTITKALILSIILGQSLGIAPAKSLAFTPMATIMTYLNITDDIAAGNSHFKAGVIRARQLIDACRKLNLANNEFGLFGVDEVFNGTTFKEGQAAAFTLIKELGQNSAGICVTNTHFPLITTLEKTGLFRNYKVSVIDEPGKNIVYTYALTPGISNQNVALKILDEEGFGDSFVKQAQQLLTQDKQ